MNPERMTLNGTTLIAFRTVESSYLSMRIAVWP